MVTTIKRQAPDPRAPWWGRLLARVVLVLLACGVKIKPLKVTYRKRRR